ncbi:hypothetical protein ACPPVU_11875 [Mucilaginibacter sp. McL0603]|uniref:hypothetical protein n=1 Tax=Mucilaginibacter sp. McL0603 TaxID=3415670 RepID=UPI003CE7D7C9
MACQKSWRLKNINVVILCKSMQCLQSSANRTFAQIGEAAEKKGHEFKTAGVYTDKNKVWDELFN